MYLNLFSTIKKNTYEVTSDHDDAMMIETNTDIDNTSEIFEKENAIESLKFRNRLYTENLITTSDKLKLIKWNNRLLILFVILSLLGYFGFSELVILNVLLDITTISFAFIKLIYIPLIVGFKSKLIKKQGLLEEKIHDNQEQIELIQNEVQKLKKQYAYRELEEVPQVTLSELPEEQRADTMQIRKLTKSYIRR